MRRAALSLDHSRKAPKLLSGERVPVDRALVVGDVDAAHLVHEGGRLEDRVDQSPDQQRGRDENEKSGKNAFRRLRRH